MNTRRKVFIAINTAGVMMMIHKIDLSVLIPLTVVACQVGGRGAVRLCKILDIICCREGRNCC